MTKFILHGGCTRVESESNRNFFKEIINGLTDGATIVCLFHAAPRESWDEKFDQIKQKIAAASDEKTCNFVLGDECQEELVEQLERADVIYMHGGDTLQLKDALSGIENFAALLKGKVVVGSSAGAYLLSRYCFSTRRRIVLEGFGILRIKTFCHYTPDQVGELQLLTEHGEDLEIHVIPEEHFVVITK